jgi:hypothetical protein
VRTWGVSTMDSQLCWLVELLDTHGLHYWIDAGTLLGLIREGGPLEHDADIDIGVWRRDVSRLEEVVGPRIVSAGYSLVASTYGANRFQYKFAGVRGTSQRDIDISVYDISGDYAWSPQVVSPLRLPRMDQGRVMRFIRLLAYAIWKTAFPRVSLSRWPFSSLIDVYTWWVPAAHFLETCTICIDGVTFSIPSRHEEYLRLHYAEWQKPVKEWVFLRDDGALVRQSPVEILGYAGNREGLGG